MFKIIEQVENKIKILLSYGYPDLDDLTAKTAANNYTNFVRSMNVKLLPTQTEPHERCKYICIYYYKINVYTIECSQFE